MTDGLTVKLANLIRGNDRGAITLRLVVSAALVAGSVGLGGIGFTSSASAAAKPDIDICHANSNVNGKPYVHQSPSATADAGGHGGPGQHVEPVYPGDVNGKWGDIIPPFPIIGGGTYPGLNYSGLGVLIYANGCELPPDLRLAKTGPATGFLNETGSYTLTVSNPTGGPTSGPATAKITVTDTVPAGWAPVSATGQSGKGFTCGISGQVITCETDSDLAQDSTFTITVVIRYDSLGLKTNAASVASPSDSDATNNSATASTTVGLRPAPDLTVGKTAPANVVVGDAGSYVLTVTNSGNLASSGTITVTDTLPAGVTAGTLPTGCSALGATVTCASTGVLAPAGTVSFTIPVTFTAVGSIVNNASVAGGGEANTSNNTASATTAVAGIPDLTLGKTAPANALVGDSGSYVLTVTNAGNGPTSGTITVTDTLPAGVTAGAMPAGCAQVGATVTCSSAAALAPAATVSFTIPVTFTAPGSIVNNASVAGGGERTTTNNSATATTSVTVAPVPDVTLGKTAPANAVIGDSGSYVLTVTNSGAVASTSGTITVTDTLPAGVTAGTLPTGCSALGATVTCASTGVLAPAGTVSFTIPVTFTAVGSIVNNASVAGGGEANTSNNTASATTAVAGIPDLTLGKTAPANALVGDSGSYVLTVTNAGNGPTSGTITVTDTLPAGVTAGAMPAGCAQVGATVTCSSAAALAPAATVSFTIPVTFTAVGSIVNNASVAGGGETNTANNTATATTAVTARPVPDLALTKSGPASRTTNQTGDYTLVVENVGTAPATSLITVTDTLPAGVTVTGPITTGGFTCNVAVNVVTCTTNDDIAVGAANAKTITLPATFTTVGNKANTATVSVNGDGNAANNTSVANTVVTDPQGPPPPPPALPADLAVKKTGPASVTPGGTATWVLTVTNKGPGNASGFSVTDTLPAGVTLSSLSGTSFTCTAATLVCTFTSVLLPAQTAVVTVVGNVSSAVTGTSIANVVVVGPTDATPADNTDTLVSAIDRPAAPAPADLVLAKAGPELVVAGEQITWTITVTNAGGQDATGFTVGDPLAVGVDLVGGSGDGFFCTTNLPLACVFPGTLAPGATATLQVTGVVDEDYQSTSVSNSASAPLANDPTPENNTDSVTVPVAAAIGGGEEEPATGSPSPSPSASPLPDLPFVPEEEAPEALPFTGSSTDQLLAFGGVLSLMGLLLIVTGRRRRALG